MFQLIFKADLYL